MKDLKMNCGYTLQLRLVQARTGGIQIYRYDIGV
jgi:hypothetical protein